MGSVLPNTNRKEREKQLNSKKEEEEEIKKIRGAALFYLKVLRSGGSPAVRSMQHPAGWIGSVYTDIPNLYDDIKNVLM